MEEPTLGQTRTTLEVQQQRIRNALWQLPLCCWRYPIAHHPAQAHAPRHQPPAGTPWTPQHLAGHLRDSTRIAAERIRQYQFGTRPRLITLVPDSATRLAGYAETAPQTLLDQIDHAHQHLQHRLASITTDHLQRTAVHDVYGHVALADLITSMPHHYLQHADQLEAVLKRTPTAEKDRHLGSCSSLFSQ